MAGVDLEIHPGEFLAGLVWFALFVTHYGDPGAWSGGVLRTEIPPRSRIATGIRCGNLEMLAKDAGDLIARRGNLPNLWPKRLGDLGHGARTDVSRGWLRSGVKTEILA